MPLPMVHLAIAVALSRAWDNEPTPAFLLGTLAPDAIHMRPDTDRGDKSRVHLHRAIRAQGLLAVQELFAELVTQDGNLHDLALGYAVHLLTDALWVDRLFLPFRAETALPRDEERALYYRETDAVDRLLYERAPWRPDVWQALATARPADLPGLLTADEIGRWRDRTLTWFAGLPQAPLPLAEEPQAEDPQAENPQAGGPPRYFTCKRVQAFIADAADRIAVELAGWEQAQIGG